MYYPRFSPPLYNITAPTLYDAGRQHGAAAAERIRAWFATQEIQELVQFVSVAPGRKAFEDLRGRSADAFPQYASELRGIADGAGVSEELVWTAILVGVVVRV